MMVSSRKDFWSATEFSDEDVIRRVELSNPDPAIDKPLTEEEYLASLEGRRVLLLVHGYNNTEDDVNLGYEKILGTVQSTLPGQYDVVTGYTWPGGALGLSYPIARARANSAGPRFALWLKKIAKVAKALDVMCHSLGARVVLEALEPATGVRLRNLYLFAAAVDNESIERGEDYHEATRRCDRVVVVHARTDRTLGLWYRIGDALMPWQWLDFFDAALGYSGPEDPADIIHFSKNVVVANGKGQRLEHGSYKDHPAVYGFLARLLAGKVKGQFHTL